MMKIYPSWFVFFLLIMMGVFFVSSSSVWFMMWVGFELSLLGFLPMFNGSILLVEGMVKYFLVQAGGSVLFLFSFLSSIEVCSGFIFLSGMFMKLGIFPFYHWVASVMSSLSWGGCMLLVTVQKVAPFIVILMYDGCYFFLVIFCGVMSILLGGVLGVIQSYMRPLMGYSSISHSGWLVCASVFSVKVFLAYFLIYCFLVVFLFSIFSSLSVLSVIGGGYVGFYWFLLVLSLLNLAGLPPFSVFFLKLLILKLTISFLSAVFLMVAGSVLSVYFYLAIVIPGLSCVWGVGFTNFSYFFLVSFVFLSFLGPVFFLV